MIVGYSTKPSRFLYGQSSQSGVDFTKPTLHHAVKNRRERLVSAEIVKCQWGRGGRSSGERRRCQEQYISVVNLDQDAFDLLKRLDE